MQSKMDYYLNLLSRINAIYDDVLNKKMDSYDKLNDIYKEINVLSNEIRSSDEIVKRIVNLCSEEIKIINYVYKNLNVDIDDLRKQFMDVEKNHFEITNKYIKGVITKSDIDEFGNVLNNFKDVLYIFTYNDENMIEVAKMNSKIQHYVTEILEDEEVLKIAYQNSNV